MKDNTLRKKAQQPYSPDRFSHKLNQALELHQQGNIPAAQAIYQRIIDREPRHIDALYLLGTSYIHTADYLKAAHFLAKVIKLNPQSSIAHNNLGIALEYSGDLDAATRHFESAISLDGNNAEAHINLGNVCQQAGDYARAVDCYTSALDIAPSDRAYLGLGNTYRECFEAEKALECYEKAIALSPALIEAYNGMGLVYREKGELDRAMQIYREALNLTGEHIETQWNYALLNLFNGNYREGWEGYEYGRLVRPPIRETLVDSDTEWTGVDSLTDKSILVYAEQGIGDEIMFASCLPELMRLTDKIHIICDPRLADIYRRSFNPTAVHELNGLESIRQCLAEHTIDYSIPSGSLPRYFRNDISEFHPERQYLYADADKVRRWRQRYDDIDARPKIGIAWFGGRHNYAKAQRSTDLLEWSELLKTLNAAYVNLQYGDCHTALAQLFASEGIKVHDWTDSDPLVNMDDYFAKVQALDLVITIDNSTAHVAGALGVPTFVLLPEAPDWRWLSQGNTSPWYASLHLLRKPGDTSWRTFINDSAAEIQAFLDDPALSNRTHGQTGSPAIATSREESVISDEAGNITIEVLYEAGRESTDPATSVTCAIITPVGPGHGDILQQCRQSLTQAISICPGQFGHIEHICLDDSQGQVGRSRARNIAVEMAHDRGIDWLFFIDADDLMAPNAFEIASLLAKDYDAIWGKICSFDHSTNQIDERPGQLGETTHLYDIVFNDPYLTLQMGHFVRTEIAVANPFDETMDAGEDFDYYLRIWKAYRCIRLNAVLFINRRGFHSSGPRSADGGDWRTAVHKVIDRFCEEDEPVTCFTKYDTEIRFLITNPFDLIQRQLIMRDFFEINELEFIRSRLHANVSILEVGANIGNHIVYYSRFIPCRRIIAIEPNPDAITILKKNLELNAIDNVDISRLGIGVGNRSARYRLEPRANNLGATQLVEDVTGDIQVARLDDIIDEHVDFIKIDVENMELEVLDGARQLIDASKPQILIEVMNANIEIFQAMIEEMGYRVTTTFRNVNASNFFIEPVQIK